MLISQKLMENSENMEQTKNFKNMEELGIIENIAKLTEKSKNRRKCLREEIISVLQVILRYSSFGCMNFMSMQRIRYRSHSDSQANSQ